MKDRGKNKSIFVEGFEDYIDSQIVEIPFPFMKEMELDCRGRKIPIVSPATGALIAGLVNLLQPSRVLEIGTGPGYSTLWMASGLDCCHITSIDRNAELLAEAASYLQKADLGKVEIELQQRYALEYLQENLHKLDQFDLIFVDCDKILYPKIVTLLLENYHNQFLFDNVLWHGRIANPDNRLPSDNAVREFWQKIKDSKRKWTLFPSGDGLLFANATINQKK